MAVITVAQALKLCKREGERWLPNSRCFLLPDNQAEVVEITEHRDGRYLVHYRYSASGRLWNRVCGTDSKLTLVGGKDAEES
jgi:hypothetical protein